MSQTHLQTPVSSPVHGPSLVVALTVMLSATCYPPLLTGPNGQARHGLALALFWAMSAGFVRGVGFVPQGLLARRLFSAWSCAAGLAAACCMLWVQ